MHSKLNLCTFCTVMRHIIIVECKCKCVYSRIYCSFNLRSKKRILFGNIYIIYCARLYIMLLFILEYEIRCIWWPNFTSRRRLALSRVKIMNALKITFTKFKARHGRARSIFFLSTRRILTRSLKGMLQFCSNNSVHDKIWISNIYLFLLIYF